jgi:hypothetical protein
MLAIFGLDESARFPFCKLLEVRGARRAPVQADLARMAT